MWFWLWRRRRRRRRRRWLHWIDLRVTKRANLPFASSSSSSIPPPLFLPCKCPRYDIHNVSVYKKLNLAKNSPLSTLKEEKCHQKYFYVFLANPVPWYTHADLLVTKGGEGKEGGVCSMRRRRYHYQFRGGSITLTYISQTKRQEITSFLNVTCVKVGHTAHTTVSLLYVPLCISCPLCLTYPQTQTYNTILG